jgi:transcriptional regulator with XRE-family HTH domain
MTDRQSSPGSDIVPVAYRKPSWGILCRLADNLKRYRLLRGYTQEELATRCGFVRSYVSNVEQARINVTLANLEALAGGLECGEEELLMRDR